MSDHPEIGEVKFATQTTKTHRTAYGFIYTLDEDDEQTGEEVFFLIRFGVYPVIDPERFRVTHGPYIRKGLPKPKRPRGGDKLVFTRNEKGEVIAWSYLS